MKNPFILTCLLSLCVAAPANASIIQWNLSNVSAVGGESLTGFVDYDTSADSLLAWDIIGTGQLNTTFSSNNSAGFSLNTGEVANGGFSFSNQNAGFDYSLHLQGLGNSDSIFAGISDISLNGPPGMLDSPSRMMGTISIDPLAFDLTDVNGTLVNAGQVSAVQLPASLPMMLAALMGLSLFAGYRRRGAKQVVSA